MFMVSYLIGLIIAVFISLAEYLLIYSIPLYVTIKIIQNQEKGKYNQCASYFCIIGILTFIEYITFHLFEYFMSYRILRLVFITALQMNDFSLSHQLIVTATPFMTPYNAPIKDAINQIESAMSQTAKR